MKGLAVLLLALGLRCALGHELVQNRANVVLRDGNHVTVTFHLAYTEALHRLLAPAQSYREFALAHAALPEDRLRPLLARAQDQWQRETRLLTADGRAAPLQRWAWPDARRVQALLRERGMQAAVAPAAHEHEPVLEVVAEFRAPRPVASLRMQFPPAFQRVLLVWYRPAQAWVEPKSVSPEIRF
jgi:hypothetical protein